MYLSGRIVNSSQTIEGTGMSLAAISGARSGRAADIPGSGSDFCVA